MTRSSMPLTIALPFSLMFVDFLILLTLRIQVLGGKIRRGKSEWEQTTAKQA